MIPLFIYINQALINQTTKLSNQVNKIQQDMKTMKHVQDEFQEMFQCLEEGILLVRDQTINFSNDLFKDIISRLKVNNAENEYTDTLDLKIFKVFRKNEDLKDNKSESSDYP